MRSNVRFFVLEPRISGFALPLSQLFFGFVLGYAVALLDLASELVTAPSDDVQIVVGQFAPLLFDLASQLFPTTLNFVPVHENFL